MNPSPEDDAHIQAMADAHEAAAACFIATRGAG
jgi:hypothetical protein